jgi:hypothetical protein
MEILKQELRTKVQNESKNSNLVDEFLDMSGKVDE